MIRRNYTSLQISIANDGALLTPGTYDVFGLTSTMLGRGASAGTEGPDVNCSANFGYLAGTGSVDLTEVTSSEVAGSYTLGFGDYGSVSGTFRTPICPPVTGTASEMTSSTCAP